MPSQAQIEQEEEDEAEELRLAEAQAALTRRQKQADKDEEEDAKKKRDEENEKVWLLAILGESTAEESAAAEQAIKDADEAAAAEAETGAAEGASTPLGRVATAFGKVAKALFVPAIVAGTVIAGSYTVHAATTGAGGKIKEAAVYLSKEECERLKGQGYVAVARYITRFQHSAGFRAHHPDTPYEDPADGGVGNDKGLTPAEIKNIADAGLHLVVWYENTDKPEVEVGYAPGTPLHQRPGYRDAMIAMKRIRDLGLPAGTVVNFCIDFDGNPKDAIQYFRDIQAALEENRHRPPGERLPDITIGVYAPRDLTLALIREKLIKFVYAPGAWRGHDLSRSGVADAQQNIDRAGNLLPADLIHPEIALAFEPLGGGKHAALKQEQAGYHTAAPKPGGQKPETET